MIRNIVSIRSFEDVLLWVINYFFLCHVVVGGSSVPSIKPKITRMYTIRCLPIIFTFLLIHKESQFVNDSEITNILPCSCDTSIFCVTSIIKITIIAGMIHVNLLSMHD